MTVTNEDEYDLLGTIEHLRKRPHVIVSVDVPYDRNDKLVNVLSGNRYGPFDKVVESLACETIESVRRVDFLAQLVLGHLFWCVMTT